MKVWPQTAEKLRAIAAATGVPIVRLLDKWADRELARLGDLDGRVVGVPLPEPPIMGIPADRDAVRVMLVGVINELCFAAEPVGDTMTIPLEVWNAEIIPLFAGEAAEPAEGAFSNYLTMVQMHTLEALANDARRDNDIERLHLILSEIERRNR